MNGMPQQTIYSHGKLLLTGEYLVLEGARALAVPTSRGQSLTVENIEKASCYLDWKALDSKGNAWLVAALDEDLNIISSSGEAPVKWLKELLLAAKKLTPSFLNGGGAFRVVTSIEFPIDWGLGSSSTLVNNIAIWAKADPYKLLSMTFGGSGYDIACARSETPVIYYLESGKPVVEKADFRPSFADRLFFVYLGAKQDSREEIKRYRSLGKADEFLIGEISSITDELVKCESLEEFSRYLTEHEKLIGRLINLVPVGQGLFREYPGAVKSLGAWGGDFLLATGGKEEKEYFTKRGYNIILDYREMVLQG